MSATPASTLANPEQLIADLQRQLAEREAELAECKAESDEALEQQAATTEVLQVINSSPGDLTPVFDAILEKAHSLCGAAAGGLVIIEGEQYRAVAVHSEPSFAKFWMELGWVRTAPGAFELLRRGEPLHTSDVTADDQSRLSPQYNQLVELSGARSLLIVPLCKDNTLLGMITAFRQEVRPFSEKQIALLQNFAAQAVIAMENARLITETREALERQTATAEVLQVINSSPRELKAVFDAILEKAHNLCGADYGALLTYEGGRFWPAAGLGASARVGEAMGVGIPDTHGSFPQLVRGARLVHIHDMAELAARDPEDSVRRALVEVGGIRTQLMVALRKDNVLLGVITANRKQVKPFTDKQIALLQNFAAQAVIAMENARLLNELQDRTRDLQESLEYQKATSDVLQVISRSIFDLQPLFDTVCETAARLCDAEMAGLLTRDGDVYRVTADYAVSPEWAAITRARTWKPGRDTTTGRALLERQVVHVADVTADVEHRYPETREIAKIRTLLSVPLLREDEPIGVITLARQRVEPFTERQIELVRTFADQAVIAIENTRLITETREALEQQTATAEVLQVINSSPGDLEPVFAAMLEKATRLCDAPSGIFWTFDGKFSRATALHGIPQPYAEYLQEPIPLDPQTGLGQVRQGKPIVVDLDVAAEEPYRTGNPQRRALVDLGRARSVVRAPLIKDSKLLGILTVYRQEVRPFSEKQIALLQNFAAQAVIAMENARLLTETREALEQQTATAEVLQVINSSPGDLAPVFDAILEKAHTLCGAEYGGLATYDGEYFRLVAARGYPSHMVEALRRPFRGNFSHQQLLHGERYVHIEDVLALPKMADSAGQATQEGGFRTVLMVPLHKDGALLGHISASRREAHPFSDKQIALLENFAAQAVIAMDNARLLTETREALEQQTATAQVLQVINSSPGDLAPVFEAMLEQALSLCGAAFGGLWTFDGEYFVIAAVRGVPPSLAEYFREPLPALGVLGDIVRGETIVQMADIAADEAYRTGPPARRVLADLGGARTTVWMALRKEEALLGLISIYRQDVRPFSDKQIALLQNFAAQAVIAMDNARLLGELRERTHDLEQSLEYQTATSDVLQVISRSTFHLQPVLDTLISTAARLCQAEVGHITTRDGDVYRPVTTFALSPERDSFIRTLEFKADDTTVVGRTVLHRNVTHVADMQTEPGYASAPGVVRSQGTRTVLGVPLLREGELIGALVLGRLQVNPFTERQIELVRTFADQAVIAIENTRLITETREALEQQQAIAEVLQVINRSPGDLAPVYDVILEKARNLCDVPIGGLMLYDGHLFRTVALHGLPEEFLDEALRPFPPGPPHERLIRGERLLHEPDYQAISLPGRHPAARALVELGVRTTLVVPLRKDDKLLGFLAANRQEVRPFSDKEIALLESFAAQAVIAMDNARLLNEIRQRQAELRVTFDNMGDGVAMFDAELRLAAWNLNFQRILELPDTLLAERPSVPEFVRYLAAHGEYGVVDIEAEVRRLSERAGTQWSAERTRPDGQVIEVRSNPVPGGGVVLIYSDITERKRAEAEIRSARDTAERALQELQTAQASLLHAQKMAALGQLTAGIAHEIKNPLNFVNNFAELSGELLLELKETTAPLVTALGENERAAVDEVVEMLRGNLDKIAEHGKRADGIVKSMLEHSRGVSGERRMLDLNALIEEALNLAYHGARAQDVSFNVTLEREFDRGLALIELAPQEMTRVFLNLFGNGFYATAKRQRDGAGPDFRPTLTVVTRDFGEAVEVRVRDNGTGITPEIRDKLFQPFVTTKPTGEGTGLGLSISYDIVTQQHGGTITVESEPGAYTEFTVRLPRH